MLCRLLVVLAPLGMFSWEPLREVNNAVLSVNHLLEEDPFTVHMALVPTLMGCLYYLIGKNYGGRSEMLKELFMSVCYCYLLLKLLMEVEDVLALYYRDSDSTITIIRIGASLINLDINMFEIRHLLKVLRP